MRKQCFKIVAGVIFTLSVYNSAAQNDAKPVMERYSVSSEQKNNQTPVAVPELKKSSVDANSNKNSSGSTEQSNAPELKRSDYSATRKEQPKNN